MARKKKTEETPIVEETKEIPKSILNKINIKNDKDESLLQRTRDSFRNLNQFSRGNTISYDPNLAQSAVVVIGCGGIGAWVARFLGQISSLKAIVLIDSDNIEMTNLNRTPFSYTHVGMSKVEALAEVITSSNGSIDIFPMYTKMNDQFFIDYDLKTDCQKIIRYVPSFIVIDCRDDSYNDYDLIKKNLGSSTRIFRIAYDGTSITVDMTPEKREVYGQGGYRIVPSHILPSSFSAQLIISFIFRELKITEQPSDMATAMDYIFRKLKNEPLTFDLKDFPGMLYLSQYIMHNYETNETCAKLINELCENKKYAKGIYRKSSDIVPEGQVRDYSPHYIDPATNYNYLHGDRLEDPINF